MRKFSYSNRKQPPEVTQLRNRKTEIRTRFPIMPLAMMDDSHPFPLIFITVLEILWGEFPLAIFCHLRGLLVKLPPSRA